MKNILLINSARMTLVLQQLHQYVLMIGDQRFLHGMINAEHAHVSLLLQPEVRANGVRLSYQRLDVRVMPSKHVLKARKHGVRVRCPGIVRTRQQVSSYASNFALLPVRPQVLHLHAPRSDHGFHHLQQCWFDSTNIHGPCAE